jgi:hypothetical protein
VRASECLEAALKRGADELMNRAEYALRQKPRTLARLRRRYIEFCLHVYRAIERHTRNSR